MPVVYGAKEEARILQGWTVDLVAGLIMLLVALFVFRHILDTRRVAFSDRTKAVDGDEARRLGEEGGDAHREHRRASRAPVQPPPRRDRCPHLQPRHGGGRHAANN